MNEASRTHVTAPSGNVHSGDGVQNNYHQTFVDPAALRPDPRRRRRSHRIASEDLIGLRRDFVAPRGLGAARDTLRERRTVLLTGEAGAGRDSAALTLLGELPRKSGRLHKLDEQPDEEEPPLSPHQVEDEDRLLLDLTATEETLTEQLLRTLPAFRASVLEKRAFLAVTLPSARGHLLPDQLTPFAVALERPDALRVLRRHLLVRGLEPSEKELRDDRLTGYLRRASMGDTARLARALTARGRDRAGDGNFTLRLDRALTDLAPKGPHVATKVKTLADGRELALFLTAALLEHARADVVSVAADSMVRAVSHPPDEAPLLHRPALTDRLAAFGAHITPEGRVEFDDGLAAAVRAYFWDNYPGLRAKLVPWAERTVSLPLLDQRDQYGFVERYAEQCLRIGTPEDLVTLVKQWAWTRVWGQKKQMSVAGRALSTGVVDRRHGAYFRQQIYHWSRQSELPPPLAHLLVKVCAEVMSVDHPSQAQTRLHHLARRGGRGVAEQAESGLLRLAHSESYLFRRLLLNLTDEESRWARVDARLFLALAEPARLAVRTDRSRPYLSDAAVRERLAVGWSQVLSDLPQEEWAGRLDTWLAEAASAPHDTRHHLLDVLVASCQEDLPGLSRLYRHVRDRSARGAPERELYDTFWAKCAVVLDPTPRTWPQGSTAREAP